MQIVYGPVNCMKHAAKLPTIREAMLAEAPTLAAFTRAKGKDFTTGLVMGWLVYLNDILNLNKPMTEDQVELCALEIVDAHYTLKMSDLTYLFRRIISGTYGEFYESLTVAKVLSFFRDYFEQRCNIAEENTQRHHRDFSSRSEFNYTTNLKRIFRGVSERS